ncbi:MAG: hypothetical protein ACOH5I_04020 [Oligoflexus sp.]
MIVLQQVSLFVACRDQRDIIRVANDIKPWPGIHVKVDSSRPLMPQVRQAWAEFMGKPEFAGKLQALGTIEPLLKLTDHETSCLFVLAMQASDFRAPESWPTLPELLRSLPAGRNRVAYNKAFQILAGALSDEFHAIEVDETIQKRLADLLKGDT